MQPQCGDEYGKDRDERHVRGGAARAEGGDAFEIPEVGEQGRAEGQRQQDEPDGWRSVCEARLGDRAFCGKADCKQHHAADEGGGGGGGKRIYAGQHAPPDE